MFKKTNYKRTAFLLSLAMILSLVGCEVQANHIGIVYGNTAPSAVETQSTETVVLPTIAQNTVPTATVPMDTLPTDTLPLETHLTVIVPNETAPEPTEPAEPSFTEPVPTDPVTTEPEPTEPEISEPTDPAPMPTQPEPSEPVLTDPIPTEPEATEPTPTEPVAPDPTIPDAEATEKEPEYDVVNETVYATTNVNVRSGPGTDNKKIASLKKGESVLRIGICENGWSKVIYNGCEAYVFSQYLTTTEPIDISLEYPLVYSDETCTITIYREWFENAWCYAAHLEFTDYARFATACANGAYGNGYETTSHAAKRLDAIFAVNGCYSAPYLDYTVVRNGVICNGADRNLCVPAVYSGKTGLLLCAWETGGDTRVKGKVQQLVDDGMVTDTFCFGPPFLVNGEIVCSSGGSRAQRTFIGTNGNAGDIWVVVSDGRYNDGESAGLTGEQCARYLASKGCTFGVALDGGGSSTMYFNGQVLNAEAGNERKVVDFLYITKP